jgi:hypothetical protein
MERTSTISATKRELVEFSLVGFSKVLGQASPR